jgi:DUF3050 family protein
MKRFGLAQFSAIALRRRDDLGTHALYRELETLEDLRRFMESHVFALWDFMSLLKRLQQALTCVTVPWVPPLSPRAARLVNQAVLHEESGVDTAGACASRFQVYHRLMRDIGADTTHIDAVIASVEQGSGFRAELTPEPARSFVINTFRVLERSKIHEIAAAATFGREDALPEGFRRLLESLDAAHSGLFAHARYYLDGHIGTTEADHTATALTLLHELCGEDAEKWRDAAVAVDSAVAARLSLWDGIQTRIRRARSGVRSSQTLDEMVAPMLTGKTVAR